MIRGPELEKQENNNYWMKLIPAIGNTAYRLADEKLRNIGPIGEVISDETRKILGKESYYDQQARTENEQYWRDYQKNTGIEPKYPIRSGSDWNAPIQTMPQIGTLTKPMKALYGGQSL